MSTAVADAPPAEKKAPRIAKPEVECYFEKTTFEVGEHANLRRALMVRGISPYDGIHKLLHCPGVGVCGTCGVEILEGMENLTPRTAFEKVQLIGCPPTFRLSCQSFVKRGKVVVITHPKIR